MRRLLDGLCGTLAALALFSIMLLTAVDVTGRKLADASLPGSLELTELLMVVVLFAGLPLVSAHGEHVVFDSLDRWIGPRLRRLQAVVVDTLCAAGLAGVAWLMRGKAVELAGYGDTTAQLHIPQAPFVHGIALLCGVTALVHLARAWASLRARRPLDP